MCGLLPASAHPPADAKNGLRISPQTVNAYHAGDAVGRLPATAHLPAQRHRGDLVWARHVRSITEHPTSATTLRRR